MVAPHVRFFQVSSAFVVAGIASSCSLRVGSGGPPPSTDKGNGQVFGTSACARVGTETKIGFGAGAQSFAFAWDTDHYVVVYPDSATGDIFAGTLASDGAAMGAPVDVQATPAKSDLPSLLKTANGYVVAWEEGSAGNAVYAHGLDPGAQPWGEGVTVAATQLPQPRPVLSRAPRGEIAVAWMDQFADGGQGVEIATLDPTSLQVTASHRLALTDSAGWPWVAGDDQVLAMVWRDQGTESNGTASYDIPFAPIDPQSLQPTGQTSLRGRATTAAALPRMVRTTAGFLAAWEDMRGSDNQIFMSIVDGSGNALGGGLVEEPNSGDANWPNMAWTGQAGAVVYYQWRDSRPQIFVSFVDGTGTRVGGLHDLQVSNGASGTSKYPDVVWTGSEFGVMYVDTRDGTAALWFQRVSCQG
jgi:hypothetical protein